MIDGIEFNPYFLGELVLTMRAFSLAELMR